jgi:hypothetical protein
MICFKYLVRKHVGESMMMQTLRDGVFKLNHLLFDELFKRRKTRTN